VQIMKLPIVQLSPFSRYFVPLRSKYSPQHPVPSQQRSMSVERCWLATHRSPGLKPTVWRLLDIPCSSEYTVNAEVFLTSHLVCRCYNDVIRRNIVRLRLFLL
jgi:hypothetical protein